MYQHFKNFILVVLCLNLLPQLVQADEQQLNELKAEAVSIVKKFGGTLKPKLKQAIKSGGPVNAIEICSKEAPEIASNLSQQTGWTVKRVSLKPRNSKMAVADEWETKVLKLFDQRQEEGIPADKLVHVEIVNGQFRFMKAQGVEAVCMNCHAASINDDVEVKLNQLYPEDKARGYSLGQVRGAFSLSKDL